MKVLTLYEPWATLVVHGIKKIETRPKPTSWTAEKGIYLIHAAKKWIRQQEDICFKNPFFGYLHKLGLINNNTYRVPEIEFPYLGHIIGSIEVTECCQIFALAHPIIIPKKEESLIILNYAANPEDVSYWNLIGKERQFGDYTEGRYAWILQNPRILKNPIPYKGGQGYYQDFKGNINDLIFES